MRLGLTISSAVLFALAGCSGKDISLGDGQAAAVPGVTRPVFAEPVLLTELSVDDADDDDPSLTNDGLELLFNSDRAGNEDIWMASSADGGLNFVSPVSVDELNSEDRETGLALSGDGLHLWFSSDREGTIGGLDVFYTTRSAIGSPWLPPVRVVELCTEGDDLASSVSDDLLELWLARRANADEEYDLFVTRREAAAAEWGEAQVLAELNSSDGESDAFVLSSGLGIVFTQDEELMFAARTTPATPFEQAEALVELNSSRDDQDPWLSPNLDVIVFASDRSGPYRLYRAQRL